MPILPEATEEARRIVTEAAGRGLILRLLGGLAVRIHSPSATHRSLSRSYPDLDFAYADRRGYRVEELMAELGYAANKSFNLYNGDHRLLFFDDANQRQVDVFVGKFHMCHYVPFPAQRILLEPLTLPVAELLLTKVQIVQMNDKDVRDICALLLDHPLGEGDAEMVNLPYITGLCADDWGWWKTATLNVRKVREASRAIALDADSRERLEERLATLERALDQAPKSVRWKIRARVGERVPWYELPEEVKRG